MYEIKQKYKRNQIEINWKSYGNQLEIKQKSKRNQKDMYESYRIQIERKQICMNEIEIKYKFIK